MEWNWESITRIFNITMASVGICALLWKAFKYWPKYQARTRDFWWVLFSWCAAALFGTVEQLFEWDTTIRIFFSMFALFLTLKVTFKPNEAENPVITKDW